MNVRLLVTVRLGLLSDWLDLSDWLNNSVTVRPVEPVRLVVSDYQSYRLPVTVRLLETVRLLVTVRLLATVRLLLQSDWDYCQTG